MSDCDDTCIAYYFFDFKDTAKQDVKGLLASLLTQIAGAFSSLPLPLANLFQRHRLRNPDRPTYPTVDELIEVLIGVINLCPALFVIVDALDECTQIGILMKTLCAIMDESTSVCRYLFTSRAEYEVQSAFERKNIEVMRIENAAVDHDVAIYVHAVLATDNRLRAHRQAIKDLIAISFTAGAHGMCVATTDFLLLTLTLSRFRWVQCQVNHIRRLRTANDVKHALQNLPPDLDQTYDNILLSVQPEDRGMLRKALQLLIFSARPMVLREVAEAIMIEPSTTEIDEDDRLQRPEDLLDIGRGLFVDNLATSSGFCLLELSHYLVKEYLLSERIKKGKAAIFAIGQASAELANTKILFAYLTLQVFETTWQAFYAKLSECHNSQNSYLAGDFLTKQHEQRLEQYPLLLYAARHCFTHHCTTEAVQREVSSLVVKSLSAPRRGWWENMLYTCVYDPLDPILSYSRVFRYSPINGFARLNLRIIVQGLLAAGVPVDCEPERPRSIEPYPEGLTALHRAAEFGHTNLCRTLIDAGANLQGTTHCDCPLSAAARSGKPEIVHMMLDAGADVVKDSRPLSETQLVMWWRYVEEKDNSKWREILDILRDAGAKWSTLGLLAAFSQAIKPMINFAGDVLMEDSVGNEWTKGDAFEYVVDEMEGNTLQALHWLAQDDAGVTGFKASVETALYAIHESQPHLLTRDARLPTTKFSAEEVVAENLIYIYFRLAPNVMTNSKSEPIAQQADDALLTTLWESRRSATTTAKARESSPLDAASSHDAGQPSESAKPWEAEGLIICGEILRAWTRSRWDESYAAFH